MFLNIRNRRNNASKAKQGSQGRRSSALTKSTGSFSSTKSPLLSLDSTQHSVYLSPGEAQGRRRSGLTRSRGSFSSTRSLLSLDTTQHSVNLSPGEATRSLKQAHKRWVKQLVKNPDLKVAVIGGGIYGCHFANAFDDACAEAAMALEMQINAKLTIFEKDNTLFSQASGKNSFRIHKGFHYPRTGSTRRMCYNDHNKFIQRYPSFFRTAFDEERSETIPAFSKVFAVAKDDKTKDYDAMRDLLKGAKYHESGESLWDEIDGELWSEEIRNSVEANKHREQMEDLGFDPDLIDGAFLVQAEPILYADKPGLWFTEQFQQSSSIELEMGQLVDRDAIKAGGPRGDILVHGRPFDLVLNCTYNQAIPLQLSHHKAFYDLCISVIVAEKDLNDTSSPAVSFGIFDGPFPSLEPYDFAAEDLSSSGLEEYKGRNLFQIFDVELSSIAQSCDPSEAYMLMASWEEKKKHGCEDYQKVVHDIWEKCNKFFPRLESDFDLAGTWFALKTKVEDQNASRPLIVLPDKTVDEEGRFIQVFSSKLTSIFEAEEAVLDVVENRDEIGLDILL